MFALTWSPFHRRVQQVRGSDKRSLQKECLRNSLEHCSPHLYRSTLCITTNRTTAAASDSCTKPFLHGPTCDPNAVRLRGIGLERFLVDFSGLKGWLKAQGTEHLLELSDSSLYLLICGIAAIACFAV